MFNFLSAFIDRCLFTVAFIAGVQFPEFIQQYSQRLSGHLNEATQQLEQFQHIANIHFQGDLAKMVEQYAANIEPSIVKTAALIESTSNRVTQLKMHLNSIETPEYLMKLYNFALNYDFEIAQSTLNQFQLAIPLNALALLTGLVIAFVVLLSTYSFCGCVKLAKNKVMSKKSKIIEI